MHEWAWKTAVALLGFDFHYSVHYAWNEGERVMWLMCCLWKVEVIEVVEVVSVLKMIKLVMHVCIWHQCSLDIGVP
jgi:hypothetical protein